MSGAGNTLETALSLNGAGWVQQLRDRVDVAQPNDYYRFSLDSASSLSLSLQNLSGDATLQLLGSRGNVLQSSTNPGATAEALNAVLDPGLYYIRVASALPNTTTNYTLNFNVQSSTTIDLAWRDYATGNNLLWTMGGTNNTSSVSSIATIPTTTNWQMAAIADFNNDGTSDMVWREYTGGTTGIWFMSNTNPNSIASIELLPGAAPSWQIEDVVDFNRDGAREIIWRNYVSGDSVIWFMGGTNNTSITAIETLPLLPTNWRIEGVADFNSDGALDIFWRDYISGTNGIWFMSRAHSLTVMSTQYTEARSTNWAIEGILDMNRDGTPDLFWRDYATGVNEVWFMGGTNGTTIASVGAIASMPTTWQVLPVLKTGQPPTPDTPGNTLATAFDVGVLGRAVYQDVVSSTDTNDYYRFTLNSRSTFNLALRGLTTDANVQLLNANGTLIQSSLNGGALPESINTTLDSGTYFVRVFPAVGATPYTLNLSATTLPTSSTIVALTTPDANAAEVSAGQPSNPGQFLITRTGSTTTTLTVNYTLSGTATNGVDYTQLATNGCDL